MNRIIKNLIFIAVILALIILGQQPYFQERGKVVYGVVYGEAAKWVNIYWQKGEEFFKTKILWRITGEVEKRKEIAGEEIKKETEKAAENIFQKIKNYIFGLFRGL